VYNEDGDKCRGIKKMRKLWEHAEGEIQAEEMDHIEKLITACRARSSRVNKKGMN